MNLSYWEIKTWLTNVDFVVIGSGIVGLNCALKLKKRFPKTKILILEKGTLPHGASTKNAGFACFGSLSEIIEDLKSHSETEVLQLVEKRIKGLRLLRETLGDEKLDYKELGGYELFKDDDGLFENCISERAHINSFLKPLFDKDVYSLKANSFGFNKIKPQYVFNQLKGKLIQVK